MPPTRWRLGGDTSEPRQGDRQPDERGPWTVVSTFGLFDHTLLTRVSRVEAEQLLDDVRCDDCGRTLSGVPPWESGVVVSQYVCRHCQDAGDEWRGTEFALVQEGADVDLDVL